MARTKIPSKPRLLYLILCDTFTSDASGKKSLIGTFDRIWARKLPYSFPRLAIVTGWEGIEGDYTMHVEILAPNERPVFNSPRIGLRFQRPLYREDAIIQLENLKFSQPGIHHVRVSLGKDQISTYPLLVEELSENETEKLRTQ